MHINAVAVCCPGVLQDLISGVSGAMGLSGRHSAEHLGIIPGSTKADA